MFEYNRFVYDLLGEEETRDRVEKQVQGTKNILRKGTYSEICNIQQRETILEG